MLKNGQKPPRPAIALPSCYLVTYSQTRKATLKKHNSQSVTRNRQATRYETCQQDTHTDNYVNPTLRPGRDELQSKWWKAQCAHSPTVTSCATPFPQVSPGANPPFPLVFTGSGKVEEMRGSLSSYLQCCRCRRFEVIHRVCSGAWGVVTPKTDVSISWKVTLCVPRLGAGRRTQVCSGRYGQSAAHTSYLSRTPRTCPCKFFLAGVNFYRFNTKNWQFSVYFAVRTQKIGNLLCILS